jgi:hypothetical protein
MCAREKVVDWRGVWAHYSPNAAPELDFHIVTVTESPGTPSTFVILSKAKDLIRTKMRFFTALRMTVIW